MRMAGLAVAVHTSAAAFDELAAEWTGLLARAAVDTVFLTPAYKRVWWRHLGHGDLLLLTVRDADGALLGLAPLFITAQPDQGRVLQTVGCVEVSDYLDWIAARGEEEAVLTALLDFLASPAAPAWDCIDLCNIHRDSPTLRLLPAIAHRHGWRAETSVQDVCPVVDLPPTWEEYLELLRGKDRHELRRKTRRAEALEELRWYIVGPQHDLQAEIEDFMALMAASSPDKAAFLAPPMRAFFHDLARAAFDAGWLQLSFLALGEKKLAAYFNLVYKERVLVYNSGLDAGSDPGFGAGIVLTGYLIQHAIKSGYRAYDFLRGDERYKYRFGGVDVTVHRLLVTRQQQ
jgi:CelD/BcsL family acetyltransferase involved in cellulose biosynthesis